MPSAGADGTGLRSPSSMSRGLFWADSYVDTASGIGSLADISGKKIAVPDYCVTAALVEDHAEDLCGIEPNQNTW